MSEVTEGTEKRVLDKLLGLFPFPHDAKGERHGAVLVPVNKSPEPPDVTAANRFDYFLIRIRHCAGPVFPLYTLRLQSRTRGFTPVTALPARPSDPRVKP